MIVTPINPPGQSASAQPAAPASPRDRAIAQLKATMQSPQQPTQVSDLPVQNANKVDVQELSGLSQSSKGDEAPLEATPVQEPAVPSPKEDPALSSQYAALARREKALRARAVQQEQALRSREDAIKAREASLNPPAPSFDPSKYVSREDIQKDPFSVLANLGLGYDQLTELAVNAPSADQIKLQQMQANYDAKIKALEEKLEGTNKSIKEQETNAYQGAINQIRQDVRSLINKDPAFDTIKITGQSEEVVKLIESVYKNGMGSEYPKGTVLDSYEAAKMVEDEVAEYLYQMSSKAQKVSNRFKPQVASTQPAPKPQNQQPSSSPQQMKTLTNNMTSSRQMSARDRAILAGRGELK